MGRLAEVVKYFRKPKEDAKPKDSWFDIQKAVQLAASIWNEDQIAGMSAGDVASILEEAEGGRPGGQARLWEDMLDRDGHLSALVQVRKTLILASRLRMRTPEGVSDIRAITDSQYQEITNALLHRLDLYSIMEHLIDDIFIGYAGGLLDWDTSQSIPVGFHPIHATAWLFDGAGNPAIRIEDKELALGELPQGQYIFSSYRIWTQHPARAGVVRRLAWPFFFKHSTNKFWMRFLERYGVPPIIAAIEQGVFKNETIRRQMLDAFRSMASAGIIMYPYDRDKFPVGGNASPVQAVSMPGSYNRVHHDAVSEINRAMTLLILGQIGSTEGEPGRLGRNDAMDAVVRSLIQSDCRRIARALNEALVLPMWIMRHGPDTLEQAPRLVLEVDMTDAIQAYTDAIARLEGAGFEVAESDIARLTGLTVTRKVQNAATQGDEGT